MSELAEEPTHGARSLWEGPVTDTHGFGALTLKAATDYVHAMADLFDTSHPPLYAHLTLARAALESTVVSAWLSEPGITGVERIKRGLCEMLYSAKEVDELKLDARGSERVTFWSEVADAFGWTVTGRMKPTIDGARRPRVSDGILELTGGEDGSRVGDLLYSRLSAVDHVTWFGLTSVFDVDAAEHDGYSGMAAVPLMVDGAKVSAYTYYVVKALHSAADKRFMLMGWGDELWREAEGSADELERRLLEVAVRPAR